MNEGKVIFEKEKYDSGRYLVEVGDYHWQGTIWYYEGRYKKKSSAISRAERLIAKGKYDTVRVIDTEATDRTEEE